MKGKFIVIEGIDGSGKTTISNMLRSKLANNGFEVIYTYEPINNELINLIEEYGRTLGAVVEALLIAADRYIHTMNVIIPNLRLGRIVICDRYVFSSIAYQGARGADVNWIRVINKFAVKPDIAIYLDVRPEVGIRRISKSKRRKLAYLENISLLHKVREIYLSLVKNGELTLVNAERKLNDVFNDVYNIVMEQLSKTINS